MADFGHERSGSDDWMDAQLRNVPVPRGLSARLRAARERVEAGREPPRADGAPTSELSDPFDARMDALLKNVEVPLDLESRLRSIARPGWPAAWKQVSRTVWAAAASLALFATAGLYLALMEGGREMAATATGEQSADVPPETLLANVPFDDAPIDDAPLEPGEPATRPTRRQTPLTVPLGQPQLAEGAPRKLLDSVTGVTTSLRQAIEAKKLAQVALGAHGQIEPLPVLAVLEPPVARGVTPPRVNGFDYLFLLRHGEHPVVSPAADKALQVSPVPLTFRTESYDRAGELIAAGRMPPRDEVRVEDFLAAQQYLLPPAPNYGVAVHAAGCPSPLVENGKHLLQLALQGAQQPRMRQRPTHLVALVDTSLAMQTAARDNLVARALGRLGRQLGPQDKVTLIGFSATPRVLLEGAGRDALMALSAPGGLEVTPGKADMVAAIEAAVDALATLADSENRQVILVSAEGAPDASQLEATREALNQLARSGTAWHFVGLSAGGEGEVWHDLAREARGRASRVQSADELFAACYEPFAGRSTLVARGAALRVAFNPKVVASYRLLGHEAATLTGDAENPLAVDLHAEQVATGMFELTVRPNVQGDLGMVELVWSDPNSGQQRRQVQPLRADLLAPSFAQAPAWVQQGVVAARTAEMLRGSYYVASSRRLGQLLDLAGEVESGVDKSPEFRGLVRLIQQADRIR